MDQMAEIRDLKQENRRLRKALDESERRRKELTERLEGGSDAGAILARWQILVVQVIHQLEDARWRFPTEGQTRAFFADHWTLRDELLAKLDKLRSELAGLRSGVTVEVMDADSSGSVAATMVD